MPCSHTWILIARPPVGSLPGGQMYYKCIACKCTSTKEQPIQPVSRIVDPQMDLAYSEGLKTYDALTDNEKTTIQSQHPRYCFAKGWVAAKNDRVDVQWKEGDDGV